MKKSLLSLAAVALVSGAAFAGEAVPAGQKPSRAVAFLFLTASCGRGNVLRLACRYPTMDRANSRRFTAPARSGFFLERTSGFGEVEAVEVHDLGPCRNEIAHEVL